MKESGFKNPFSTFNKPIEKTMYVFPDTHKECIGPCKCKKVPIEFKYPNIVDRKDGDFCQKHHLKFDNECHKLPSGKLHWTGCPQCRILKNKIAVMYDLAEFMEKDGMVYNHATGEWSKKETKIPANDEYRDVKKRKFDD